MDASAVEELFLKRWGLRLEPEMCRYVLRQLERTALPPEGGGLAVMGGDARTGAAVRRFIPIHDLSDVSAPQTQGTPA